DIYQIRIYGFHNLSRKCHRFFITSENLDAYRPFIIKYIQLFTAFHGITDQAFGRDKFRIHHIRAMHFAEPAERWIRNIFHRSQKEWEIREFYIANFNHSTKIRNWIVRGKGVMALWVKS